MLTLYGLEEMRREPDSVITVGTFDGVHLGHKAILETVTRRAAAIGGRSVAITFDPHPRETLGRGPVEYLGTLQDRLARISALGVDTTVVIRFTYEFSQQTADEFYRGTLLQHIAVREVIVGHDHQFGRDRRAGFAELERLGSEAGFRTFLVPPVVLNDGTVISSSAIRALLREGNVQRAAELLGYPYSLTGTVLMGDQRGRTLGFPTANIDPERSGTMVPANGVYLVAVDIDGTRYYGMVNLGVRPTFGDAGRRLLEAHLFNFDGDLYGRELRVVFLRRIRAEQKFASKDELVSQLERDRAASLARVNEFL